MEPNKTTTAPLINLSQKLDGTEDTAAFARHVAEGLSQTQKTLLSRYFYDGQGSRLFQQIMELPEYYLTRCEFEVLQTHKQAIAAHFSDPGFFHLVDLGAGDALKTKILLQELTQSQKGFDYVPVDISGDAMQQLRGTLQKEMPLLEVQAVVGEYFSALDWMHQHKPDRKVVLFLGSNIGNFKEAESQNFLRSVRRYLKAGDKLLLGVDLRKDPETVLKAYSDASGVTAAFNLNLLTRINRELGGNFNLEQFRHYALYNPQDGVMRSFLVSKIEQEVHIGALQQSYHFDAWETIHTENSHKYTLPQVEALASASGFKVEKVFQDKQCRFADVLLTVAS
ncbi:dimethylhistidine N-methyltransferase [Pontibacter ummariensis]|uniref:Dimethylhistidine N-methyltransferase n=1 Tax=Pontibacter ummariensis TaxID=1610492 RepID=A0A239C8R7_9BACT|nr:L-histidine N(alpha)-methyltransferase [Pontibacter ummariensis]PRY15382.1 dimethylhistidine N-methyltransferase [Pontibacter ummariensis]SNS16635.1 dimethylhistidine N-methyltransferase [Pontibacter ummariensis]